MHDNHSGYRPESAAVIAAGNAIDGALHKRLQRAGFRVQLLSPDQLDQLRPGALVINASACAGVKAMDAALAVCRALQGKPPGALLHLSSYRVFPGTDTRRRRDEEDIPAPESEAGRRWLACEQALADMSNASILRLGWLVDRNTDALLGRVLRGLLAGQALELDDGSHGNPVTVADLSRVVVALAQQLASGAPLSGIYHYGAADSCTALEYAREVADRMQSLSGEDFSTQLTALDQSRHSGNVVLACGRLRDVFGIQQRSWRQGLTRQVELKMAEIRGQGANSQG